VRQYPAEDDNKLIIRFEVFFSIFLFTSQNFSFDVRSAPGNLIKGCGISTPVRYYPSY